MTTHIIMLTLFCVGVTLGLIEIEEKQMIMPSANIPCLEQAFQQAKHLQEVKGLPLDSVMVFMGHPISSGINHCPNDRGGYLVQTADGFSVFEVLNLQVEYRFVSKDDTDLYLSYKRVSKKLAPSAA